MGGRGTGRTAVRPYTTIVFLLTLLAVLLTPFGARAAEGWSDSTGTIVYSVAGSADGSLVVTGRRDNQIAAYDGAGNPLWQFPTEGTVFDVAVSDDGQRIAAASEDRRVYLLDGSGKELWRHEGQQTFTSVAITSDGGIVIAGSEDRTVTALDTAGKHLWSFKATDEVTEVAVYGGASAYRALAGTRDSRVTLINAKGKSLWEGRLDFTVRGLGVTANGAQVIAGDDKGNVVLLDGASGKELWSESAGDRINAAEISRDGSRVVAATRSGEILVFNAEGKEQGSQATGLEIYDLTVPANAGAALLGTSNRVIFATQESNGSFSIPEPPSRLERWWPYIAGVAGVLIVVGVLLGLRRRPNGERAWHGYARHQRQLGQEIWRGRISYLFLLPTVSLLVIFNYYPAFSGIIHAFTVWQPGSETRWVGLDQFRSLKDDKYFWTGIGNLVILIVTAFLKLILPLLVAEFIFHLRSHKLRYAMRTLFVLQVIVPGVVGILLWVNVYDPNVGLANQVLRGLGLESWAKVWLGDTDTALWSIIFIGFPWVSAFALLIFYGGLISIPSEIFDAAQVDGAGAIRRFFNIDLPLLLGQVRLLVILTFIAVVQEFAAVFLTTGGGPGSSTYVPSLELYYQAVRFNNFGLASAIGAVLFVVILIGTIINLRYVKSSVEYGV